MNLSQERLDMGILSMRLVTPTQINPCSLQRSTIQPPLLGVNGQEMVTLRAPFLACTTLLLRCCLMVRVLHS